jgi:MFS family permease
MNQRVLLTGVTANAIGNGAMAPYVIPWLAELDHGSLGTAGLLYAVAGVGQLGASLSTARLVRIVQPKALLVGGLLVAAAAGALLPILGLSGALTLLFVLGAGQGLASAAQAVLLGDLVADGGLPERIWSSVQMAVNAGLGAGFLAGGLLVSPGSVIGWPAEINAVSFASYALLAAIVLPRVRRSATTARPTARFRLGARVIRTVLFSDFVFLIVGVGFLLVLPVLATDVHVLALGEAAAMLAANTVVDIVLQMSVRRWQQRLSRPAVLRLLALGTASAWGLVALGALVGPGWLSSSLIWCAVALVSLAECLHTASVVPLLGALSSPEQRPRVLALHSFAAKVGHLYGPAIASLGLALSATGTWLAAAALCAAPALARITVMTRTEV